MLTNNTLVGTRNESTLVERDNKRRSFREIVNASSQNLNFIPHQSSEFMEYIPATYHLALQN